MFRFGIMEHRSLTEGLLLLFSIPFSIVIFLALLFSLCGHYLLINTWMDGWMDGWNAEAEFVVLHDSACSLQKSPCEKLSPPGVRDYSYPE